MIDRAGLIRQLMQTFLGELQEHARTIEETLLTMERGDAAQDRSALTGALFRAAHSLKSAARAVDLPAIERLCHALEDIFAAVREGALEIDGNRAEALFAAVDALKEAGERVRRGDEAIEGAMLDGLLRRLGSLAAGRTKNAAKGAALSAPASASPPTPDRPPLPNAAASAEPDESEIVRVSAAKLDSLLARGGEMLLARRRLESFSSRMEQVIEMVQKQRAGTSKVERRLRQGAPSSRSVREATRPLHDGLGQVARSLESLRRDFSGATALLEMVAATLERDVHRARLFPFADACAGLDRMVRDLARAEGKEIDFSVADGRIELDRSLLQAARPAILHLVRNAVTHGIETPDDRAAAGKPRAGAISVAAALQGNRVEISVSDDGRGLEAEAIRAAAERHGLLAPNQTFDAASVIFAPGLTTRPEETMTGDGMVSGRGVGLDAVRAIAESQRGAVHVASEPGLGARFAMDMPLTLTTIQALLVSAGGQTYAIDATAVARVRMVDGTDIQPVGSRDMISVGEDMVPVTSLARLLEPDLAAPATEGKRMPAVLLRWTAGTVAVIVDAVLGEHEIVAKSLGPRLAKAPNLAGATVLENGRVALILNGAMLVQTALGDTAPSRVFAQRDERAAARRLLVADDSVTTRTLEASLLEMAGYSVLSAPDGREAWDLLQEHPVDLVVLDVDMPRMNGFELTELIRGSGRLRDLPVILVTGRESEADRARGSEAGADAYLVKSAFDQTLLLNTIQRLL